MRRSLSTIWRWFCSSSSRFPEPRAATRRSWVIVPRRRKVAIVAIVDSYRRVSSTHTAVRSERLHRFPHCQRHWSLVRRSRPDAATSRLRVPATVTRHVDRSSRIVVERLGGTRNWEKWGMRFSIHERIYNVLVLLALPLFPRESSRGRHVANRVRAKRDARRRNESNGTRAGTRIRIHQPPSFPRWHFCSPPNVGSPLGHLVHGLTGDSSASRGISLLGNARFLPSSMKMHRFLMTTLCLCIHRCHV